jgi:hypothetical protein
MKPEEKYRVKLDKAFEPYFEIYREVRSNCGKGRLDYVLKCKESGAFFGIEVKKNQQKEDDRLRGNDWGKFLKQAEGYTKMSFNKKHPEIPNKILIFITPSLSTYFKEVDLNSKTEINGYTFFKPKHEDHQLHSNVNSIVSCGFNVGEIKKLGKGKWQYFGFVFQNKRIWSSRYKLDFNNYEHYNSKL